MFLKINFYLYTYIYLFNQMTEENIFSLQNDILDSFNFWLPFVEVRNIIVKIDSDDKNEVILQVEEMCSKLLANPIIEQYEFDINQI